MNRLRSIASGALGGLVLFAAGPPCEAATIAVDLKGGADFTEIQPALDAAADGDTVLVRPGEYVVREPISFNLHRKPGDPFPRNIILRAEKGPEETVIRRSIAPKMPGAQVRACVAAFESGETEASVLEGFTLTGGVGREGYATPGSGIYCSDSSPRIVDCRMAGNRAYEYGSAGGLFCRNSSPTLVRCTISDNSTGWDTSGAGATLYDSSPKFIDCVITRNLADAALAGGVSCEGRSVPEFTRCSISGNFGTGVLDRGSGSSTYTECLIAGNQGPGLVLSSRNPSLVRCTIAWNSGSGLICGGTTVTARSCIIWFNGGSSIEIQEDGVVDAARSCIQGSPLWPGEGNIDADPLFCRWEDRPEVWVDGSRPGPGEGTAADPYKDIRKALEFGYGLSEDSPCRGTGEGGADMGAPLGTCGAGPKAAARLVHVAPGAYPVTRLSLYHNASLEGAGQDRTVIEGTLRDLRGGARLSGLTVTGGPSGGVLVFPDESPEIRDCTIARGERSGVECGQDSSPRLTGCTIAENRRYGVLCLPGSSVALTRCTIVMNGSEPMYSPGCGVHCWDAAATIESCIIWDNVGGSLEIYGNSSAVVSRSCLQGDAVWPGEGNVNSDPLFCGWGDRTEAYVDASSPGPGDGSPAAPYASLVPALEGFSFALSARSPCRGTGEGGIDMGAPHGRCDGAGGKSRLVHVAPGTYPIAGRSLFPYLSIQGAGKDRTTIAGTVLGLRTGATLSDLAVTDGEQGGVFVLSGQSPEIRNCLLRGNRGGGIICDRSSPTISDCTITGAGPGGGIVGSGVVCNQSSPELLRCAIARNLNGGIYCMDSSPALTRCVISDNFGCGAIFYGDSSSVLTQCTITGNCVETGVAGVWTSSESTGIRLTSCIVWDNLGESIHGDGISVEYSCFEAGGSGAGEGNIHVDPGFVGWGNRSELFVDAGSPGPGDGTPANPYPSVAAALSSYSLELSAGSPCRGAGKGGADMGAGLGVGGAAGSPEVLIRLAGGTYDMGGLHLFHRASVRGAGEDRTAIEGSLYGLRTGTMVSDVKVTGGTAGGIVVTQGLSPEIVRCTVVGNSACYGTNRGEYGAGGGVYCASGSSPLIADSTLAGNEGSGVFCAWGSSPRIVRSRIAGNAVGGIRLRDAAATIEDCTVIGNANTGVSGYESVASLTNCVVAGNAGFAVGLFGSGAPDPRLRFTNCTFSGNGGDPTAICGNTEVVRMVNCIVWGNEDDTTRASLSHCLIGEDPLFEKDGVFDFTRAAWAEIGGGRYLLPDYIVEEPDYRLRPGSPGIDAGAAEGAPAADIDGRPRPCGGGVDIGAYEGEECAGTRFVRGDADSSGKLDLSDAVFVLHFEFLGGPAPGCRDAADADDTGQLDIADAIRILSYQFLGGPPPAGPFPDCGLDPGIDGLSCLEFPPCR